MAIPNAAPAAVYTLMNGAIEPTTDDGLVTLSNQVIITSRRKDRLTEVAKANPGMAWAGLDIEDPESISTNCRLRELALHL